MYVLDHFRSLFQSKGVILFVSLKPCFIHLIGALWDPLVIGPLALKHSSVEIGAIIFPGIQNVMMLRYTSHAQSMDLNIDMNQYEVFLFTLLGEWYFKIQVL